MKNDDEIKLQIFGEISKLIGDKSFKVTENTPIIQSEVLDSMKLVELCIALEDKAIDIGFEFDWTSEATMSRSRSIFKSAGTLAEEFINQLRSNK
tara:strand:- start:961 stop:1245 length:285 start_codon:yes stop_codon:yes gene_type:complete